MNLTKTLLLIVSLLMSVPLLGKEGGDDAGNGGFAYKQSIVILKMAATALENKISDSSMQEFVDHPDWRLILQDTLAYQAIEQLPKKNKYRGGRKLAMDYQVTPAKVTVLKPYFEAFAGKTTSELEDASLEVQKRLIHEAAHIWGYNEESADKFATAFMAKVDVDGKRPTFDISIKNDYCVCRNGKSDVINNCDQFCATKTPTSDSILYVNTIIGPLTAMHAKLGNLHNWCTVQLSGDVTSPKCLLTANDGNDEIQIPVNLNQNSNAFSANVSRLGKNKTWILKLVEAQTGSNAQTKEFQIRLQHPEDRPDYPMGALKVIPVNQYTCLTYGGKLDSSGEIYRTNYAKIFYYFNMTEIPAPMPPASGANPSMIVCHDEKQNPGDDSAMYERLELVKNHVAMWDTKDVRFTTSMNGAGKLMMNKILEERLLTEYNITANLDLFRMVSFANPKFNSSSILGYMMIPFTDSRTGNSFCPTSGTYESYSPLFNLLGEYMADTEGLFLAEKEAETILNGATYKTLYGTMLVRESILKNYGFYIENGLKIKATANTLNTKTIYYYWPADPSADPTNGEGRKLFTVRTAGQLNGNIPVGIPGNIITSDKRIGCIPK